MMGLSMKKKSISQCLKHVCSSLMMASLSMIAKVSWCSVLTRMGLALVTRVNTFSWTPMAAVCSPSEERYYPPSLALSLSLSLYIYIYIYIFGLTIWLSRSSLVYWIELSGFSDLAEHFLFFVFLSKKKFQNGECLIGSCPFLGILIN